MDKKVKVEEKISAEIKLLVNLFLETNASDIELSKRTGISSSTVGRRLIDHDRIVYVFDNPENRIEGLNPSDPNIDYGDFIYDLVRKKRRENLQNAKIKGGKKSFENNPYVKNNAEQEIPQKIDLNKLYKDEEKQYKFLAKCILTFRLKMPVVSKLLCLDEDIIFQNLKKYCPGIVSSFTYLFDYEFVSEEETMQNFLNYYKELVVLLSQGKKEEIVDLLSIISDKKALDIRKKRQLENVRLTLEDAIVILNYQLKYSASPSAIQYYFNVNLSAYSSLLNRYFQEHPEVKLRYDNLINMHQDSYSKLRLG